MVDPSSLPKTYEAAQVEAAVSALWTDKALFSATPDQRDNRYVIMMPLPNVTGALHMGHAMDNVMQDLLVRWHRMMGDNTLWMPGTDHAGIATQAVVEKRLKELEGLTRHDVGREGLIDRIWRWKDQYQQRIVTQQQRMGCSCDWQRQRFTMDAICTRAVRHAFFRLYQDGLISRGKRLINWDAYLQTSVSDDEVYHETVAGHFWHLRYPIIDPEPGEPDHVVVATTRPETMLGDTAVAVHPDPAAVLADKIAAAENALKQTADKQRPPIETELAALRDRQRQRLPQLERLRDMARAGRMVMLPLQQRPIPLICDEWAKPELGSGCVKITPAHDPNDYEVWKRHREQIAIINLLEPNGSYNQMAGAYAGLDRFDVRKRVVADLEQQGLLEQIEDREVEIGHSDRSKTPVEPYLSDQWFIFMGDRDGGVLMGRKTTKEHRSPGLVQAAIDAVRDGRVAIHPQRYTKTYLDWLSEKRDWPISRQLWWGHRIPVWSKELSTKNLDVAQLNTIVSHGACVRIHIPEHERSYAVAAGGNLPPEVLNRDDRCLIDVCLLEDDAQLLARLSEQGFERDADVLDTWFSSALWPFSTLGWPDPETAVVEKGQPALASSGGNPSALDYYYPGSCLVTGRDIITLWVARMVLAGLYTRGDVPFSDVFIHANILDGKGERMSKSKGNGIDPVDIIDRYGTDAMRYVLCDMRTGSQDIRLPVTAICPACEHHNDLAKAKHGRSIFTYLCSSCSREFDVLGSLPDLPAATLISERFDVGKAFCTKLWNSVRFALLNLQGHQAATLGTLTDSDLALEDRWILAGLNKTLAEVDKALATYNPSAALNGARDFFWGALCDWYLELIKPRLQGDDESSKIVAQRVLAYCLDQVLRMFHPMIPFITEHLWQRLNEQWPSRSLGLVQAVPSEQLAVAQWPEPTPRLEADDVVAVFATVQETVRALRELRANAGVSPREQLTATLKVSASRATNFEAHQNLISSLAGLEKLTIDSAAQRQPGTAVRVLEGCEVHLHGVVDEDAERERLEAQLAKVSDEIARCERKLANPKFVDKAPPAVVEAQRGRLADYKAQRAALEQTLLALV